MDLFSSHFTIAFLIKTTIVLALGFGRGSSTGFPASSLAFFQSVRNAAERMAFSIAMDACHLLWDRRRLARMLPAHRK